MSPFLYFSNEKRQEMQKCNPDLKVTDISAKLGEIWRDMTDEQKEPYVKKSAADRDRYHKEQEVFKSKNSKPDNPEEKTPTPTVNPPDCGHSESVECTNEREFNESIIFAAI